MENKTNKNKFQIIPISRIQTDDILVTDEPLRYATEGKVLGLTFNGRGTSPQTTMTTIASVIFLLEEFYEII